MKIVASFSLDPEHVRKLGLIAKRTGLSRSDVVRRLIERAELVTPVIERIEIVVPPPEEEGSNLP